MNVKGYFLFGISYGIASLSCTLPIFLSVIGTSFAASTILTSLSQFLLYGMGMGVVIMVLTLGVAFFKSAMLGTIRKMLPYVGPIRFLAHGNSRRLHSVLLAHHRRTAVAVYPAKPG